MRDYAYREMYELETSHFWFLGKQKFVDQAMRLISPSSPHILDIGSGTGGTTKNLSKWGKVVSVEQNKLAASLSRKRGIAVTTASADKLPFSKNMFDIVTILDVLYHKGINEHVVLQEAFRVVKPGGYIIITDCAVPWLWSKHDEIMDAKYRYTKKHLSQVITRAGYNLHTIRYTYASIFPIVALLRIARKIIPQSDSLSMPPPIINTFLFTMLTWESSLFPTFNPPIGSSIIAIAQKPSW